VQRLALILVAAPRPVPKIQIVAQQQQQQQNNTNNNKYGNIPIRQFGRQRGFFDVVLKIAKRLMEFEQKRTKDGVRTCRCST
jgi:hypothetical protein